MLYQLSYFRIVVLLVGVVGFEPTQPKQQIYSLPRLSNFGAPPAFFNRYRAGGGIRTPDPLITNQLLWPTELHRQDCQFGNAFSKANAKIDIFQLYVNTELKNILSFLM
jgi:hypothetical protein